MATRAVSLETVEVPVLIVGAGAAGLRAAIELRQRGIDCLVIGKRAHGDAHTRQAAGGINAVLGSRDPEDRWEVHFADTLREGHFACDPRAVELLCHQAPECVQELDAWGCAFNRTPDGRIDQRYFGAHTYRVRASPAIARARRSCACSWSGHARWASPIAPASSSRAFSGIADVPAA